MSQTVCWIRRRVPPGVRTVLGLLLIAGGVFGFLPVLGFWMIPFGLGVIALDIMPLLRFIGGTLSKKPEPAPGGDKQCTEEQERK